MNNCMCKSNNFRCYEFEGECIIAKCKDCGRFEIEDIKPFLGIQLWSNGEYYFCNYGGTSPLYKINNNKVFRVRGEKKLFGYKQDKVKCKEYDYPPKKVEDNYKERIKHLKNELSNMTKNYEKFKETQK